MSSISCAGISPAYLAENGIRHVGPEEANQLVGCAHAGRLFPYFQDRAGARVPIGDPVDTPFFRLRKDGVIAGNKYHQAAGTRQHGYLPINWAGGPEGSPLGRPRA